MMTFNEAILCAEHELDRYEKQNRNTEFWKLIIGALKKQVLTYPPIEGDGYADGELVYDTYYCPSCDAAYEIDYDNHNYCPKCGQHLMDDWNKFFSLNLDTEETEE